MTETVAHEYSSERTQRELSNEYQHDRVEMVFKSLCIFVLWMKVASALEGFRLSAAKSSHAILVKSFSQKHVRQNICRRNVNQNINNNSPSNIL